jgi:hypothetical protein
MDEIFPKLQKFVKITYVSSLSQLANNGTAIKGVCVTRRPSGHLSRYFRQETVTVGKEGMPCPDECSETGARVFAVMVQSLVEYYECRGTKQVASRFFVTM